MTLLFIDGFDTGDIQKYDDLYICNGAGSVNNNFLGDVAVETLYPNGNGSASDFVGSDGNSTALEAGVEVV